jgi:hypothetical protein
VIGEVDFIIFREAMFDVPTVLKHTWFRSYQNGEVYNFLRRTTSSGANDFWESGVVHPERILHDLQQVLTGKKTDLYYMMQLK